MNERDAIRRVKRGDIRGLAILVERYQLKAVRTAFLITRDAAVAEDIVQEVFLYLYYHLDTYDEERPFAPWFLKCVANAAVRAARKEQRYVSLDTASEKAGVDGEDLVPYDPHLAAQFDPETALENAETEEQIEQAIQALPAEQRAALVLRYYLDLSDEEISARLNCAPATVRWRLHTARKQLRVILQRLLLFC